MRNDLPPAPEVAPHDAAPELGAAVAIEAPEPEPAVLTPDALLAGVLPALKRTVLVTGGGRGIGAATAWLAAERGWAVAIGYQRDGSAAQALVDRILEIGGTALALQADVADETQVAALFATIDAALPPLGALVNNAGIVGRQARVEAIDAARLQRMFAVNVFGSFLCAKEAVRRMSTRHGGTGGAIVNVSSAAVRHGSPDIYVDYAASKGAIEVFTLGLAREVVGEGIRVNGVRPGIIDTEIHASGGLADRAREMAPLLPLQRAGTPEEVAEAILWLMSESASYTIGSFVDVAGGR